MYTFEKVSLDQLLSELDLAYDDATELSRRMEQHHKIVYKDNKPFCIFHSEHSGYGCLKVFNSDMEYYIPGECWNELAPLLESDKDFQEFMKSRQYTKEYEWIINDKFFQRIEEESRYRSGDIEFAHDAFWYEDHIIYTLLKKHKEKVIKMLWGSKGKKPIIKQHIGASILVEYP